MRIARSVRFISISFWVDPFLVVTACDDMLPTKNREPFSRADMNIISVSARLVADSAPCDCWGGNLRRYAAGALWLQQVIHGVNCHLILWNNYTAFVFFRSSFVHHSPESWLGSTPFELHDDTYVLKEMGFCERQGDDDARHALVNGGESSSSLSVYQHQTPTTPKPNEAGGKGPTPPIPGILKGRVKHEHWPSLSLSLLRSVNPVSAFFAPPPFFPRVQFFRLFKGKWGGQLVPCSSRASNPAEVNEESPAGSRPW